MVYMDPDAGSEVIRWAADKYDNAAFLTYEQINPHDAFGGMMVTNIAARGCGLKSIHAFPDIDTQCRRYLERGWQRCEGKTMLHMFDATNSDELRRVARVEWFDEVEEWQLIQAHYCIMFATKDASSSKLSSSSSSSTPAAASASASLWDDCGLEKEDVPGFVW
eukprot:Tamp_32692.p1 GENE.Tamp_32692~~Tamp_32692.p1  ORF type:complete len:164 (+),score=36.59 Tamp_32692:154-645(+)